MYVRTYMCMYLVCQDSSLSDHRSYLSPLPFSFSERSVTISGNRCILFRTRLIVLRSSKVIRIGAAVLVNESGWTFVHRCWRSIDDEKGAIIFTYFLFSLNDDLTILKDSIINLKKCFFLNTSNPSFLWIYKARLKANLLAKSFSSPIYIYIYNANSAKRAG